MLISELLRLSDSYTDEKVERSNALAYSNEAIAIINSKGFRFPFIIIEDTEYKAIPDTWIYRLVINWINYGVKMKETDLNEAMIYKQKFDEALADFLSIASDIIDDDYIGFVDPDGNKITNGIGGVYELDITDAIDMGWFGSRRGNQ